MYAIYGNGGGINNVIQKLKNNELQSFDNLNSLFNHFVETYDYKIEDLSIVQYSYDTRLNKQVYMIVADAYNNENFLLKYGHAQYVSYMIEI